MCTRQACLASKFKSSFLVVLFLNVSSFRPGLVPESAFQVDSQNGAQPFVRAILCIEQWNVVLVVELRGHSGARAPIIVLSIVPLTCAPRLRCAHCSHAPISWRIISFPFVICASPSIDCYVRSLFPIACATMAIIAQNGSHSNCNCSTKNNAAIVIIIGRGFIRTVSTRRKLFQVRISSIRIPHSLNHKTDEQAECMTSSTRFCSICFSTNYPNGC